MCLGFEAFIKVPREKLYGIQVAPLHDDKPFESRYGLLKTDSVGDFLFPNYLPTAAFN